jgi:hypothetical protein
MNLEQIRIRELETALEANMTLLALESNQVRSVQSRLIRIGHELGGVQFDQFMKVHLENDLTIDALANEITGMVRVHLGVPGIPPGTQSTTLPNDKEPDGRGQLEALTSRATRAEAEAAECRQLAAAFEKSLFEAHLRIQELEAACSPAENTSLFKAHQAAPRSGLVLRTAELFTRLGYAVNRKPERIGTDDGQGFQPDLVVSRQGEMFFLQVETGQEDDQPALARKWEQALLVGGGRIWVVTAQLAAMNSVQGRIVHWAAQGGRKGQLYLTHAEFLKWVPPDKSPWARIRELGGA